MDCVVVAAVQGYCLVGTWTFSPVSDPEGGQDRETGQATVSHQNTGSLGSWKRFFPRLLSLGRHSALREVLVVHFRMMEDNSALRNLQYCRDFLELCLTTAL